LFSFAVPSTAKEILFNSAAFASQAKRALKQYKKNMSSNLRIRALRVRANPWDVFKKTLGIRMSFFANM